MAPPPFRCSRRSASARPRRPLGWPTPPPPGPAGRRKHKGPLPQGVRGQARSLDERVELTPDDVRVDLHAAGEGSKSTVDAGDDVLPTEHAGVALDPFRHQL